MPDFGIKTALSEFGKAVEGKRFKHPETSNMVLYTSLPIDEQHRIYEQWKQYQSLLEKSPKGGDKVEDVKSLRKGDKITVYGPKSTIQAEVSGFSEGRAVASKIDPRTGKPTKDKPFAISQEAVDAFEIRRQPGSAPKKNPFKNQEEWPKVKLDDIFKNDVVSYRLKGKNRMGRVTKVAPDGSKFWIREVDPATGKVKDKAERSFDAEKIKDRDAKLVDEDLWGEYGPAEDEGPAWMGGWSGGKPKKKKLSPEERKKLEEERKAREAARRKAVEKMSKTGEPLKSTKNVEKGDVISYHYDGDVYYGRVIDARGHEFFTIDIDPETGKVQEHGFEEWRGHSLKQDDVHKVDEEHVPPDPAEENRQELYEGLTKLKEDPKLYFRDHKDAELVDLDKIKPAKVRLKGVLNGNELLEMAADGEWGKRKPISLIDNGDGTYTVRDGNSTYKNAEISGWKEIPAIVKTEEEWEELDRKEEERKKKQQMLFKKGPKVTREEAPKEKPKAFKGKKLTSTEGLKRGDRFGYEHDGRWYVGQVDRVGKDGRLIVDSLHPENGKLTTLSYIGFDDDKLKRSKAVRLKDYQFPRRKTKKKEPLKMPPKKHKGKGSGKPFMLASESEKVRAVRAAMRHAYRPRWQETPGYKTVVDLDSEKGIYPAQTESQDLDRGQDNLDSTWPVQLPQSREKERALPLPSNHSKKRDKRIGPTYFNKPRKSPDRTLSVPGEDYGHPTKYDYNYPRRRQDVTALEDEDIYEEDPVDDQLEPTAQQRRQGPFPKERQKNQGGTARLRSKQWYMRNPAHKRRMRMKYRLRDKRLPREKLKDKYYRKYPHRYKRRGIGFTTPAERTRAWRQEQKAERRRKGISRKEQRAERQENQQQRRAGLEMLAEAFEMLGLELAAANWPANWNTHVKKTKPPGQLDQNFGKGRGRGTGTPRKDPSKQKGESLRAPDLSSKPQKGLKWRLEPPASGGLDYPDAGSANTMNPTDGSGKVIPMSYYTDLVNNTQAVPDGRQDRYLRNNNFDVKVAARKLIHELCDPRSGRGAHSSFGRAGHRRVATTVGEILSRCDKKIKQRSKEYAPTLARIDTKNWIWHWNVGDYTVRVQAFKRGNATNFPKLNLKVSCSCPFWRWWGPAHWATRDDYQKGAPPGTAEYPEIRDPARWRPVCKHAYAVLQKSQDFFVRPEKSPLKKLGSRFSVDSLDAIEVVTEERDIVERVATRASEQEVARRVARRYVEKEES